MIVGWDMGASDREYTHPCPTNPPSIFSALSYAPDTFLFLLLPAHHPREVYTDSTQGLLSVDISCLLLFPQGLTSGGKANMEEEESRMPPVLLSGFVGQGLLHVQGKPIRQGFQAK